MSARMCLMSRSFRVIAALLLGMVLPAQGWAAACAQICARALEERHSEAHAGHHDEALQEGAAPHEGCGESEPGAGKCCQAHLFIAPLRPSLEPPALPSAHHTAIVARWTSFIPEEPSPPPIVSASLA